MDRIRGSALRLNFLLAVACLSMLGATANAAERPVSLFDMSLEDVLEMPVSTASKLEGRADKAAGNISVVTQDQIRRFGYRTVGEALQRVVGFLHNDVGYASYIGFRGLTPQGFTSNARILFMIDGLRHNERGYDTAFVNETFPVDIESIDRIEVLKGAGSAIWGSNALYAVVNVITKDGMSDRNKQVMGEYASHNRGKGYVSYGDKTDGGLKYFTSLSATGLDGDISAYYPAFDAPATANGIAEGFFDQEAYRYTAKVSYSDFYTNFLYSVARTSINSDVDYLIGDGGSDSFKDQPIRLESGYKFKLEGQQHGELLVRGYYTADPYRSQFKYDGYLDPANTTTATYRNTIRAVGGEVRYSQDIGDDVRALAGVELTRVYRARFQGDFKETTPDAEIVPESVGGYTQNFDRTDKSYFFDVMYSPIEELSFFAGGRFDKPSGLPSVFGPRASVVVNPTKGTILKLLYSQGFRHPSIGESLIYTPAPQSLDPEKLDFYEVLVEQRLGTWGSMTGAVFYNDLSDTLGIYNFADGNSYYTNFKGFSSRGVELEVKTRLDERLQGYANFIYATGRSKDALTDLHNVPSYVARAGISWSQRDVIVLSPELAYIGSTKADTGYRFDPYLVANLTVLSYPLAQGANLSASIYNLFDKDYARLSSGAGDSSRALESGREFRLQATWQM